MERVHIVGIVLINMCMSWLLLTLIQVASIAFHCYSSRNFRDEARADNQKEYTALPITFFFFFFFWDAPTRFWVTAYPYVVSRSLSLDTTHPIRLLVISPTHRQHTTLARERRPAPRRDSNLQSQQISDSRPTPWTARPLESTPLYFKYLKFKAFRLWRRDDSYILNDVCGPGGVVCIATGYRLDGPGIESR